MNSQAPLILLLTTPPMEPASSPLLVEYLAPLVIGILPSVVIFVGPPDVLDDWPTLG